MPVPADYPAISSLTPCHVLVRATRQLLVLPIAQAAAMAGLAEADVLRALPEDGVIATASHVISEIVEDAGGA